MDMVWPQLLALFVIGSALFAFALWRFPQGFPMTINSVISAFSAGRSRADVEEVVGIGVRDFDGPVAIGNVGRGRMTGPSASSSSAPL